MDQAVPFQDSTRVFRLRRKFEYPTAVQSLADAHEMPLSGLKWWRPAAVRLGLATMVHVRGWPGVAAGRAGPLLADMADAPLDGAMTINPANARKATRALPRMDDVLICCGPSVQRL